MTGKIGSDKIPEGFPQNTLPVEKTPTQKVGEILKNQSRHETHPSLSEKKVTKRKQEETDTIFEEPQIKASKTPPLDVKINLQDPDKTISELLKAIQSQKDLVTDQIICIFPNKNGDKLNVRIVDLNDIGINTDFISAEISADSQLKTIYEKATNKDAVHTLQTIIDNERQPLVTSQIKNIQNTLQEIKNKFTKVPESDFFSRLMSSKKTDTNAKVKIQRLFQVLQRQINLHQQHIENQKTISPKQLEYLPKLIEEANKLRATIVEQFPDLKKIPEVQKYLLTNDRIKDALTVVSDYSDIVHKAKISPFNPDVKKKLDVQFKEIDVAELKTEGYSDDEIAVIMQHTDCHRLLLDSWFDDTKIPVLPNLKQLSVYYNADFNALLPKFPSLESLILQDSNDTSDPSISLKNISLPKTLKSLDCESCRRGGLTTSNLCESIKDLSHLEELSTRVSLRNASLPKTLKKLSCSDSRVTDDSLNKVLKQVDKLETLNLHDTNISLTNVSLPKTLKALTCTDNRKITDETLNEAIKDLQNLEELDISTCPDLTLKNVSLPHTLKTLNCEFTNISTETLNEAIKDLSSLVELNIIDTIISLENISIPKSLKKLIVSPSTPVETINLIKKQHPNLDVTYGE